MFLAIDTATDFIGLSLDDGSQVLAERVWRSERHHTTELAPEIAIMLRDSNIGVASLEGIVVASGPGSYTGLRIGMAVAKGLALAHGIPMIGIPTLDILAAAQNPIEKPLLAVINAGRKRVAAVWYKWERQSWHAQNEPKSQSWDELIQALDSPTVVCGEIEAVRERLEREKFALPLSPAECVRRPSYLAQVGRSRMAEQGEADPAALAPTYLGDLEGADR